MEKRISYQKTNTDNEVAAENIYSNKSFIAISVPSFPAKARATHKARKLHKFASPSLQNGKGDWFQILQG